jgi:hypothetical protein
MRDLHLGKHLMAFVQFRHHLELGWANWRFVLFYSRAGTNHRLEVSGLDRGRQRLRRKVNQARRGDSSSVDSRDPAYEML